MVSRAVAAPHPFTLDAWAEGTLEARVARARSAARGSAGRALAGVTVGIPANLDLSAAVLAARTDGDRYFCFEQPERDGFVLAGLGAALVIEAAGTERFASVAAAVRAAAAGTVGDDPAADPTAPPGSGPVLMGGFAFAPNGGATPDWASLPPACLVLPEVSLVRRGEEARMTVSVAVEPDDDPSHVLERVRGRLSSLAPAAMPLVDPDLVARARVAAAASPSHFEEAVARAVERIGTGSLDKVVLAREVRVHAGRPLDPAPVVDALRSAFPACFCFCVGTPELAFLGASPELLVRREGARAQTVALAGTTRRSADPSVDDHLGERLRTSPKNREEHAIVARRIERRLAPMSLWVSVADEPGLVKVQNVQHLATPIRAQLADPISAVELVGRLHPTPAVGGEPWAAAEPLIPALEGLDRGWYAGPIGWTDLTEDGEFCVGIRSALIRDDVAHLYAGNGIVRDSDPAEELAETEVKLQALLPLFA